MARIKPLETVERAMEVLLALNVLGVSTISKLARFAGMPRAAVNRYIVTFEALGYVYRAPGGTSYRVSSQALELSSGVRTEDWLRRDATPEMDALSRRIGWPIGLETVRDARLSILTNTDHLSPFVARPVSTDMRLPLVGTASGHVLLSQMNDPLRRDVIKAAHLDDPGLFKRAGLNPQRLSKILDATAVEGFAIQRLSKVDWSIIAVPVPESPIIGLSLSARYRNTIVDTDGARRHVLPALASAAARISRRLAQRATEK